VPGGGTVTPRQYSSVRPIVMGRRGRVGALPRRSAAAAAAPLSAAAPADQSRAERVPSREAPRAGPSTTAQLEVGRSSPPAGESRAARFVSVHIPCPNAREFANHQETAENGQLQGADDQAQARARFCRGALDRLVVQLVRVESLGRACGTASGSSPACC
jgi:hypothetical protein